MHTLLQLGDFRILSYFSTKYFEASQEEEGGLWWTN